ncbi:hypothetical protein [Agitococcus lubricus]|uniref:Uncharacterized protein n=1 Tax=Agitococcus lubricus TaxID=1077255 RepID=A0A2T5IRT2_9GAMM|nr:hypothetical protein [Agitococcus lubricus]PTQ86542.1 hypothetical protein C8N29_1401 [Agitococcus lubricus]
MAKSGTGRVTVMGKKLFLIQTELQDIPLHYRPYVKANREFIQLLVEHHLLLDGLDIAKPLLEWMCECVSVVSEFEAL